MANKIMNKLEMFTTFVEEFLLPFGVEGILPCYQETEFQARLADQVLNDLDSRDMVVLKSYDRLWFDCGEGLITIERDNIGVNRIRYASKGICRDFIPVSIDLESLAIITDSRIAVSEMYDYLMLIIFAKTTTQ